MRANKLRGAAALALVCAVFLSLYMPVQAQAVQCSRAEVVIEVTSGRILCSRNEKECLPVASTTKILTAIIIIEDCDLDARVCIPEEAAGIEGSSIYLTAGEVLTVRDLLHGLMLRSGNDCAATLALYHSGSMDKFAAVMNERARMIRRRKLHLPQSARPAARGASRFRSGYGKNSSVCIAEQDVFRNSKL